MAEPNAPSLANLINTIELRTVDPNVLNELTPEEPQQVRQVAQEAEQNPRVISSEQSILTGLDLHLLQAMIPLSLQGRHPNVMAGVLLGGVADPSGMELSGVPQPFEDPSLTASSFVDQGTPNHHHFEESMST